jgi:uncharacterized protein
MIQKTEKFVKESVSDYDESHDFSHAQRVVRNAFEIAEEEDLNSSSLEIIHLSSLLHDVDDHKYGNEGAVKKFLEKEKYDHTEAVLDIISKVSYSKEIKNPKRKMSIEAKIVQDADRLDAIGAIGIARCFIFTTIRNEKIYDGIAHFYEKLLKLKGMMKTKKGKELAKSKHDLMLLFLEHYREESI